VVAEQEAAGEEREAVIGMTTGWQLLCVVFVLRLETVRIISARKTTRSERKIYENL
jgi:uncharacterized DUF497 family protein